MHALGTELPMMKHSLFAVYRTGWQDGCDAACAHTLTDVQAIQDARMYMELALFMWGLTPRAGVHVFHAYHMGYVQGSDCAECAPTTRLPSHR